MPEAATVMNGLLAGEYFDITRYGVGMKRALGLLRTFRRKSISPRARSKQRCIVGLRYFESHSLLIDFASGTQRWK
jgi:hypothetical protein